MADRNGWIWSGRLGKWYQHTGRPDVIITEDRVRLPVSALSEPRSMPAPERDEADHPGLSASPKYTTSKDPSLSERLNRISLSTPRSEHDSAVHRGIDRQKRIQSAIKFEPTEDITEPGLYDNGYRAHAKLVATGNTEDSEFLDRDYRLRPQGNKFFIPGRVFLVLWAQPAGANSFVTTLHTGGIIPGRHNEKVYSKVRRFVVIRAGDRSCSALSILTYNHQGSNKDHIDASEHGVVFTGKSVPAGASRAPDLLEHPIRINVDIPTDKLDPESLIHYGKVYTIEHNIKVKPFGLVHDRSLQPLLTQFHNVWVSHVGVPRANPIVATIPRSVTPQQSRVSGESTARRGSDVMQQRQPRELTERQRAAMEQASAVVGRLRRNPSNTDGRSDQRSGRGSGAGSDAAESSAEAARRAATSLYHRLKNTLLARGFSEGEADRRARRGVANRVEAASQRATTGQEHESHEAIRGDDDRGDDGRGDDGRGDDDRGDDDQGDDGRGDDGRGDDDRGDDDQGDDGLGNDEERRSGSGSGATADSPQRSRTAALQIAIDALMARGYTNIEARQVLAEAAARRKQSTGRGGGRQS
ncbi:hypothetical protein B0A48_17657 [Cryoendolithus antarcticus]|uniref:DUF6590 domain-containing protein n=1 Tax=Cryoendolithus antarcticus TaxID=1507870 RepID=A0A1V8SB60_9PEZI|nr:hypothetical protein B0A48_17657 [Cryoendolithus antarcticus]